MATKLSANSRTDNTVPQESHAVPSPQTTLAQVSIRMYRQGLGDCFLLTFTNSKGNLHHMMIDCGVLPFSSGGNQRLDLAVKNIMEITNQHVHTLVATHEHADHISGFKTAVEYFGRHENPDKNMSKPVQFDQVWLAWTENPSDPQVIKIREKDNALRMGISAAMTMMGLDTAEGQSIQDILDFYYIEPKDAEEVPDTLSLAGAKRDEFMFSQSMNNIMESLRAWGGDRVEYLEPNDVRDFPEFGFKVYILGPSRKMRMLGGNETTKNGDQTSLRLSQANAFMVAAIKQARRDLDAKALAFGKGEQVVDEGGLTTWSPQDIDEMYNLSMPFDATLGIPLNIAEGQPGVIQDLSTCTENQIFFRQQYLGKNLEKTQRPELVGAAWRRIDLDWLMMGENLALQQVSAINNTSLVMAIELYESGQVLLFVGDAEEENWDTWETDKTELDDLLRKTVVYKVGHHGSTNATRDKKLNLMTNDQLVALVPVDIQRAQKKNWEFPAPRLWLPNDKDSKAARGLLYDKTQGRVLINCSPGCAAEGPIIENLPWPGKISSDSTDDKLWVEYTLNFSEFEA